MGRPQADPSPSNYYGQAGQEQPQQFEPASNTLPQEYQCYDQVHPDTLDESNYNDEYPPQDTNYQQDPISDHPLASSDATPPPPHQQPQPQAYLHIPQPPQQPAPYPPQQNPQMAPPRTPPRTYPPPPPQAQAYPPTQAQPAVQFPPPPHQQPSQVNNYQQASSGAVQFPPPPSQANNYQQQPPGAVQMQYEPQVKFQQQQPPGVVQMQYEPQVKFQQQQQPQPQMGMGAQTPTYGAMPPSPFKPTATGFPVPNQFQNQQQEGWSSGLFDCMNNPENALITACFPCLTFGQIAEIVDEGHTSCGTSGMLYGLIAFFIGMPCLISCTYRTKLRSRYGLIETPAPDWATHLLCEWCALCQEYRELQFRGFDPAIGWQGNQAKNQSMQQQQQQMAMMPPMNQNMMG